MFFYKTEQEYRDDLTRLCGVLKRRSIEKSLLRAKCEISSICIPVGCSFDGRCRKLVEGGYHVVADELVGDQPSLIVE